MFVANQPVLILTSSVCCKRGWRWRSLTYTRCILTRGSERKPKLDSELLATRTTKVKKNNWFVAESFHVLSKPIESNNFSLSLCGHCGEVGLYLIKFFFSHKNTVRNIQYSHTRLRKSVYLGFFCFASDCLSCSWWDTKAFLSNEQIPDNEKFTIKIEPSSTRPVCNVMCQIQQINLSDKGNQLKQPKDPFTITC